MRLDSPRAPTPIAPTPGFGARSTLANSSDAASSEREALVALRRSVVTPPRALTCAGLRSALLRSRHAVLDHDSPNSPPPEPLHPLAPWRTLQRTLAGVLGVALAFPALKLLWPWPREASLTGDLYPEVTGAAIAALAVLPIFAVLFTLRRTVRPVPALLFAAAAAVALFGASRQPPTDTLEFDRWRLLAASSFALLLGGAALDRAGRLWLSRACAIVSLVTVGPSLADAEHQFSGVLGNTGLMSEAGLIGAAAGLGLAVWDTGAWRWIGGVAAFAYGVFVGIAPVFAGAAALALAALTGLVAARDARKLLALAALFALIGFAAGRIAPRPQSAPRVAGAPVAGLDNTGGIEVRQLIWARVPALLAEAGWLGVGPGQFAAQFPPHRDPREIELSSLGRRLPGQETEVQHAHNDYLQALSDFGPLGGALLLALYAWAAWRAFAILRYGEIERMPLALGLLAVLFNGLAREPLSSNPASATLAFALIGAVCAPGSPQFSTRPRLGEYSALAVAGLAIALQVPRALGLGLHGRALRNYFEQGREAERLAFVLDTRPDSVLARSIHARSLEAQGEADAFEQAAAAWSEVLALRPHSFEAWMQLGLAHARGGRVAPAREAWRTALELDPNHPGLLRNLALLEARHGDVEQALQYLAQTGAPAERALRDWAVAALRDLDVTRGWELFARADERLSELSAERAHDAARKPMEGLSEAEANALEGSAHVSWAREHAERGSASDALRSYRQARRCLAQSDAAGATSWSRALRIEYAAALVLAGEPESARAELSGLRARPDELRRLPTWAGQALMDAKLLLR